MQEEKINAKIKEVSGTFKSHKERVWQEERNSSCLRNSEKAWLEDLSDRQQATGFNISD